MIISMIMLAVICGAIPFSVILGKVILSEDIRRFGDGNPGAANAWKAGGTAVGVLAVLCDLGKAFLPVYVALTAFDFHGLALVAVAAAPVFGHAFSPFLGFRGGKAIASTYGIWLALTGLSGPLAMAMASAVFHLLQTVSAWTVIAGLLFLFGYLVFVEAGSLILLIWVLNFLVVAYKHNRELKGFMKLRPGFTGILRRR